MLVLLLTVVNSVTYVVNRTMTWLFFFLWCGMFLVKKLETKFTREEKKNHQYQIKKIYFLPIGKTHNKRGLSGNRWFFFYIAEYSWKNNTTQVEEKKCFLSRRSWRKRCDEFGRNQCGFAKDSRGATVFDEG